MSINVNVSGNPIRINRGKLVTAGDLDYDKTEFDKRRRMRLEQVRHQSKEIAENVRNKVRKEKKKQLSDFEKREEKKLKQWQNRKLLELQQQYRDSLNNIGLGHAQAVIEDTQENAAADRRVELKEKAKERGQKARQKVQSEKNKESLKKALPVQQKKLTRDVENARSSMVAKTKKSPSKKRKKKTKTNINITTNVSSSGASESGVEELDLVSDSDLPTVSDMQETGGRRKRSKSKSPNSTYRDSNSPATTFFTKADMHQIRGDSLKRSRSPLLQSIPDSSTDVPQYQEDTRISDRIMNRRYLLHPEKPAFETLKKDVIGADEVFTRSKPYTYVNSERRVDKSISAKIPDNAPSPVIICQCNCRCYDHRDKETNTQTDIPSKPTVSLKDVTTRTKDSQKRDGKVQYYDHKNRFSKEVGAPKGTVKKIPEDNIDVCCHLCECQEKQFHDKQFQNDRDAEVRGRKAAEKANVHKDYKEMLKQLPVLQKRERLARMADDKPVFHMDADRLEDHERSRQNRMENAYERHFPKTITIPPKKHVIEKEAFKSVDMTSKPEDALPETSKWDEDKLTDNGFTLTRDSGNIIIDTDAGGGNKEDYLKYLLDRLKLQKEMLLREAANLPQNSNLNSIISGLESFRQDRTDNEINVKDTVGMTLPRQRECELPSSPDTTNKSEKKPTTHKRIREQIPSMSSSSIDSSPTKRMKHRKYRIVLQNTSTQTSPKTIVPEIKPSAEDIEATTNDKVRSTKRSPKKKSSISSVRSDRASNTQVTDPQDRASSPIRVDSPIRDKKAQIEKYQKCKCKEEMQKIQRTGAKSDKNEVCEIVIKIQENEAPEINIKSPKEQTRNIMVKEIGADKVPETANKEKPKRFVKIDEIASTAGGILKGSWREQFSRSDPAATSTSTSYFSPPDYSKSDFSRLPTATSTGTGKSYRSSSQSRGKIDPRLLTYIRKLLTMSRNSIDELGVSSVSDFSTPSLTLTSDESKYGSLNQLRSIIRYFKLNPQDLAHYLSYSEDGTSTSMSTKTPSTVHSSDYEGSKSQVNNSSTNAKNSLNDSSKTSAKTTPSPMTQRTPTPARQYAELADLCEKRIAELAAMIDQVRMEKQQILSPSQSDKEHSTTQYMVLPSHSGGKSPNTSSELEQAEINRRMLEIDYSLAEQLKVRQLQQDSSAIEDEDATTGLDKELLERYRKLVTVQISDDKTTKKERLIQTVEFDEIKADITNEPVIDLPSPFTPILLDIPRLPKLITSVEASNGIEKTRKPPPAKGLMAARKFNEEITTVAHELSTIVEVDSQLSTKLRQSSSPAPIRTSVDFDPTAVLPQIPADPTDANETAKSDGSVPDIVAEIGVNTDAAAPKRSKIVQIQNEPKVIPSTSKQNIIGDHRDMGIKLADNKSEDSSTDKSEIDNIEVMLKSMGMGWAVSTLRKTKATFDIASTSSSAGTITTKLKDKSNSSDEDNAKQQSSITSDVTLRDALGRRIFYTSSTSADSLAQTPTLNLTKALTDLSAIQGSARSSENKNQRTSTPIQTTKSSESKKEGEVVTGGESEELSSVKISDEFLTMPDSTTNSSSAY